MDKSNKAILTPARPPICSRDYATIEQLVMLSNLESINAMLVHQGLIPSERLMQLNNMAIIQLKSLVAISKIQRRLTLQGG